MACTRIENSAQVSSCYFVHGGASYSASFTDILLALPIYIMLGNKHQREKENTLAYFPKASLSQERFYATASCELMRHVLMADVFANITVINVHVRFFGAISQPVHLPWTIKLLHNNLLL